MNSVDQINRLLFSIWLKLINLSLDSNEYGIHQI